MSAFDLGRAATQFAAMRRSKTAAARLEDALHPQSIDQGYALQSAVSQLLEPEKGICCGHKIGCTTPVMQEFLNIDHPCAGRLYESEVHDGAVTLRLDDFAAVGVECEIALRLGEDLKPQAKAFRYDQVAAAVSQVMAAAEIVDNRYQDFQEFGILSLIADDFFSGGAVLGPPQDPEGLYLEEATGTTLIDGMQVGSGKGEAVMGHPYNALAWLANQKAARGESLLAGDIIMTGSVVETKWITQPCTVICQTEPLGSVQITFV